jgi:hypothetical protein
MPKNPAAAPESQMPLKAGASGDLSRDKLDRRVSVAPMTDWPDELNRTNEIMNFDAVELA